MQEVTPSSFMWSTTCLGGMIRSSYHQLRSTYSFIFSKTQLTQGPFLWEDCPITNQVAQPQLEVSCSFNEPTLKPSTCLKCQTLLTRLCRRLSTTVGFLFCLMLQKILGSAKEIRSKIKIL